MEQTQRVVSYIGRNTKDFCWDYEVVPAEALTAAATLNVTTVQCMAGVCASGHQVSVETNSLATG